MATRKKSAQPDPGEFSTSIVVRTALIDGVTFRGRAIHYMDVEGVAMFEGDIVLGTVDDVDTRSQQIRDELQGSVALGVVISGSQFRWPNCEVPFEIEARLANKQRVRDAIDHWEGTTNYRFPKRSAANASRYPDYIRFVTGSGCSSMVGLRGGRQNINVGTNCSVGNVIHEIGHAVGLWHEQSREDRDLFVTIQWPNITQGMASQFLQHITDGDDVGEYDYGSIMHYPRTAFSANGQDTIVPTDPTAQIGQRAVLSAGDIAAANSLGAPPIALKVEDDPTTTKLTDDPLGAQPFVLATPHHAPTAGTLSAFVEAQLGGGQQQVATLAALAALGASVAGIAQLVAELQGELIALAAVHDALVEGLGRMTG